MRKIMSYAAAVMAAALFQSNASAQKSEKERIEGSGNVITKEVAVKSFDELSASGIFSLQLLQGDREQVKIEAEDNLQDLFVVENDGAKLKISMKKDVNFSSKKKMKVYVTFRNLKSMDLSMVGGTSSGEKLKLDELTLKNKSVGSVNLDIALQKLNLENESVGTVKLIGSAENAVIRSKGVGSIHAGEFVVQRMDISNSGVGSAEVNAVKELKLSDSFLGKVRNKGAASPKKKVVI
jgi:hypothetical protein